MTTASVDSPYDLVRAYALACSRRCLWGARGRHARARARQRRLPERRVHQPHSHERQRHEQHRHRVTHAAADAVSGDPARDQPPGPRQRPPPPRGAPSAPARTSRPRAPTPQARARPGDLPADALPARSALLRTAAATTTTTTLPAAALLSRVAGRGAPAELPAALPATALIIWHSLPGAAPADLPTAAVLGGRPAHLPAAASLSTVPTERDVRAAAGGRLHGQRCCERGRLPAAVSSSVYARTRQGVPDGPDRLPDRVVHSGRPAQSRRARTGAMKMRIQRESGAGPRTRLSEGPLGDSKRGFVPRGTNPQNKKRNGRSSAPPKPAPPKPALSNRRRPNRHCPTGAAGPSRSPRRRYFRSARGACRSGVQCRTASEGSIPDGRRGSAMGSPAAKPSGTTPAHTSSE